MIGIIAAMKVEAEFLIEDLENVKIHEISGISFYQGFLKDKEVVIAVSGVGKVNAAICTQTMILRFSPSLIVNTGVGGGLNANMKIGDIVIASYVVQHDMDTSAVGDPLGYISGIDLVKIPCYKPTQELLMSLSKSHKDTTFYNGVIATGDQFMNSKIKAKFVTDTFDAIVCEMEGASIGQVCYVNNINFNVIRIISDNGDENSGLDYSKFLKDVAILSKNLIMEFISQYK